MTDPSLADGPLVAAACGLSAGLAWGVADYCGARAAVAHDPAQAAAASQLLGAAAFAVLYALVLRGSAAFEPAGVAYAACGGLLFALGLLTFFHALAAGPVTVVAPLGSGYPLVTTIVAVLLFAARPTSLQLAGIALIVAGATACSGLLEARRSDARPTRGVRLAWATLALWGVALALLGQAVPRLGWETTALVQATASALTFACVLARLARRGELEPAGPLLRSRHMLGAGLLLVAGNAVFDVGLAHADAAGATIVAAVSACYPALTMLLAVHRLGERARVVPTCGALVAIAGIAMSAV